VRRQVQRDDFTGPLLAGGVLQALRLQHPVDFPFDLVEFGFRFADVPRTRSTPNEIHGQPALEKSA
jgi:hypothetical protein